MYFEQVNINYLDTLNIINEKTPIKASEDIYSANGMKLLSKGSRIDNRVRDNLTKHRLAKPLEKQISLDAVPIAQSLLHHIDLLLEREPLITQWLGDQFEPFHSSLKNLHLGDVPESTLNIILERFPDHFDHGLKVAAIAFRIATTLQKASKDLLCAALFHDVGYLYLEEQVWQKTSILTPKLWRQLDTHPIIGYHWALELGDFTKETPTLILQHHERVDSSGYPQRTEGKQLSLPSQILAVSEMIVGIFENKNYPTWQLMTALKLLPQQFSPSVNQVAMDLVCAIKNQVAFSGEGINIESATHDLFRKIALITEHLYDVQRFLVSDKSKNLITILLERLNTIQTALTRSGLNMLKSANVTLRNAEPHLIHEQLMIIDETLWQLRHLSRDISRRCINLTESEIHIFEPLNSKLMELLT